MLAAHPEIDVIVGRRPGDHRRARGRRGRGVADKVKLVGYGGGAIAVQGIKAGERYATVMQMPATEGRLGIEHLIRRSAPASPARASTPRRPARRRRRDAGQRRQVPALAEWPG